MRFAILGLLFGICIPCSAQDDSLFQPTTPLPFSFEDISVATIASEEGDVIQVKIETPSFRDAAVRVKRTVTEVRMEVRTRMVEEDDEIKLVRFTTAVPVYREIETTVNRRLPVGTQESIVLINTLQARNLKGERLTQDELIERLRMPTHFVLLKDRPAEGDAIDSYYATLFRSDTLLIYIGPPDE